MVDGPLGIASRIKWQDETVWKELPEWSKFYFDLGAHIVAVEDANERSITALLVPTRSFVSAFIALGAVAAAIETQGEDATNDEMLKTIAHLPSDAILTSMRAGKKVKFKFKELTPTHVVMYNNAEGMRESIPLNRAHTISVGGIGRDEYPSAKSSVTKQSWEPEFIEDALGITDATEYVRRDNFTALIVGRLNLLSEELERTGFSVRVNGKRRRGHLEDILRTRKFADDDLGEAFRTDVMSETARELLPEVAALEPPLIVFDSSHAFLKHRNSFPSGNWVAIIDRSSDRSVESVEVLNQLYAQRLRSEDLSALLELPAGVDAMSFMMSR